LHGGLGIVPARSDTPAVLDVTAESQPGRPRPSAAPRQGAQRPGLLVKVAMLELLAAHEPRLTQIVTPAGEDNEHMIAINSELGFEVLERQLSWELETARAAQS